MRSYCTQHVGPGTADPDVAGALVGFVCRTSGEGMVGGTLVAEAD